MPTLLPNSAASHLIRATGLYERPYKNTANDGAGACQVSHETIYRSLFVQARGVLKKELMEHLRSRRAIRYQAPSLNLEHLVYTERVGGFAPTDSCPSFAASMP